VGAADNLPLLDQWFAAQTNFHTWSADATETRRIKTLTQPLVSTGKVWVSVPNRFRWELGQPAQTIALRLPDDLFIIYPRLKRAEKYSLAATQQGPWKDALALLDAAFPRSRAELEARFNVLSATQTNSVGHARLQPKSAVARKFMTEIVVGFSLRDFTPVSTELKFSDGSSMRNDFTNSILNAPLPEGIFEPPLGPDIKIVEPLGR
jgi:outer membrane lipoprotein-sorting protein